VLLLEQEVSATSKSALQTVLESDTHRLDLLKEKEELSSALDELSLDDKGSGGMAKLDRLKDVEDELIAIGADSALARASRILTGLQFTQEDQEKETQKFSGGWRMRISLACALFRRPRLLLLDEPTNHLDLHAVIWLEEYLKEYPHTIVVVSHDKSFLTNVCTDVLHCFMTKLNHYKGDYSVFERQHKDFVEKYKVDYEKQQKKIKQLKKEGKIGDIASNSRDTKSKKAQREKVMDKKGKGRSKGDAQDNESSAESQMQLLQPLKEVRMSIQFTDAGELPSPIIKVDDVSFHYENFPDLFKKVSFGIDFDSRIVSFFFFCIYIYIYIYFVFPVAAMWWLDFFADATSVPSAPRASFLLSVGARSFRLLAGI